ncbi:sigma-70 family RNA polymerase sigma factor [Modestobacter muralis]|uniref:Sigma-70 family RNA polymerase sigma factor n=1 Tax=Modestobacter muralis TaxID=1608614 RepID=A0A6P0EUQ4_9ACTN|nr:sigma-70 family RNA polymerase sigma factor [Modestobacter muralis]NEN52250.1 sigma-70 family RNA polymerase sigma factor [Modestobacter muralis]
MEATEEFEAERPRLLRIAARVLADRSEAEDVVQQAWLRLHTTGTEVTDLPAWLTTVTTRLCLDRLRARTPVPHEDLTGATAPDPADEVALADTVGVALQVVLQRLSPRERVAFVLHDSFAVDFPTIAAVLDTTPAAARKLASRARARIGRPDPEGDDTGADETGEHGSAGHAADRAVVDAFMAAARGGDLGRLLALLAPDAEVGADDAAVLLGTPARISGREAVAAFFDGSASAALPVLAGDRPAAAWFQRGRAMVLFDFTLTGGLVQRITFRADPDVLSGVVRRRGRATRASHLPVAARQRGGRRPRGRRASTGEEPTVKTMTCRELGGPCDQAHHGETADEVIKAQDRHLEEAERAGDATHQAAREAMKGRWRRPRQSLAWYRDVQRDFAALPAGQRY